MSGFDGAAGAGLFHAVEGPPPWSPKRNWTQMMTQSIIDIIPPGGIEAFILAHREPTADVCRRAGIAWRGEGVPMGRYTLPEVEALMTFTGNQHGDEMTRMSAWQLVRAACHALGRPVPPVPNPAAEAARQAGSPLYAAVDPSGAPAVPSGASVGPRLTIGGKAPRGATWERLGPDTPVETMTLPAYMATTPVPAIAWEIARLEGAPLATLGDCRPDQLAALAGIQAETPAGKAFVQRARWCLDALAPAQPQLTFNN